MSNSNEPAYPTATMPGLTKRELLAAMAMQGLLANADAIRSTTTKAPVLEIRPSEAMARASVNYADALLAELAKKEVES